METFIAAESPGIGMQRAPYLSVVVTTRNDDHGGDPLKRLQAFVNCFDEQCRRTGLDAEVIIVEWNPPPERPRIGALLRIPDPCFCTYRFIEVPSELHARLRHADVLPLFQMIAKNVGIRRARGRFVLATNIDIIFSTALIERIAARDLQERVLYRVDRHDIQPDVPVDGPLEMQMSYCATHHLRIHGRRGSYPVNAAGGLVCLNDDIVDGRSVRLGDGWHVREGGGETPYYRWASDRAQLIVDRSEGQRAADVLEIEVESNPYDARSWVKVSAFDDDRLLLDTHVAGRMRLHVPLDGLAQDRGRTIELRVTDMSPTWRLQLPVFERRDAMHYRVFSAQLESKQSLAHRWHEYPASAWTNANPDSALELSPTPAGLEVTSDRRKWSYCVECGPLRAPTRSTYRFEVVCAEIDGAVGLGVLNAERTHWIPASVAERREADARRFELKVDLHRHERFWLVLFNARPDGEGVSRFTVLRLAGSAAPADTMFWRPSRIRTNRLGTWLGAAYAKLAPRAPRSRPRGLSDRRPRRIRLMSSAADVLARSIGAAIGHRLRGRIVRASPEYGSLESALRLADQQLRATAPLRDLAELHTFLRDRRPENLHVNGCGDFQLMASEHWKDLHGYPEFETFSMNIDGLFSYIADAAGIKEQTLTPPIYHLEHEVGSGWSPEGEAALRRRIAERGITWLDATTVYVWAAYMRWLGRPMIVNTSHWGMANSTLAETVHPAVSTATI
jgi:hypothetical protein